MRNKEAVKKLLGLLKDYRKIIALIIACLLISTGLNMCIPLLNRGIMDYGFIGLSLIHILSRKHSGLFAAIWCGAAKGLKCWSI